MEHIIGSSTNNNTYYYSSPCKRDNQPHGYYGGYYYGNNQENVPNDDDVSPFDMDPMEDENDNSNCLLSTPKQNPFMGIRHRRFSWSPGSETPWDSYEGRNNNNCPQQLRSNLFDPVASQLLACVEESEEGKFPSMDNIHDLLEDGGGGGGGLEEDEFEAGGPLNVRNFVPHDPLSPSGRHFSLSASMPNLLTPLSGILDMMGQDNDEGELEKIADALNSPLSPSPLFREVSDSLLDVKSNEDMNHLARPIPRKCSIPMRLP